MEKVIESLLIAVIGIAAIFFNKLYKRLKRKEHSLGPEDLKLQSNIEKYLHEALIDLDCARAYIIEFKNGEDFSLSRNWKLVIRYEQTQDGIIRVKGKIRDIESIEVLSFLKALFLGEENGIHAKLLDRSDCVNRQCERYDRGVYLVDTDEIESTYFRGMLKEFGVRGMVHTVLWDGNKPLGILGLNYCSEKHWGEAITDMQRFHAVCSYAERIIYLYLKHKRAKQ